MKRRTFIYKSAQASLAVGAMGVYACNSNKKKELPLENKAEIIESVDSLFFQISLAQWSLNRSLRSGKMTSLEFAAKSRELGCTGIEYVNTFFKDKAKDTNYLNELNAAANGEGQQNVLIMIDQEGSMAHADTDKRIKAIENHYKWRSAIWSSSSVIR